VYVACLALPPSVTVTVERRALELTVTTLANVVTDQAGLVGLIRRIHSLGLVLLSVCCAGLPQPGNDVQRTG
jgi:hypothetical protein